MSYRTLLVSGLTALAARRAGDRRHETPVSPETHQRSLLVAVIRSHDAYARTRFSERMYAYSATPLATRHRSPVEPYPYPSHCPLPLPGTAPLCDPRTSVRPSLLAHDLCRQPAV
jgi:hypothetical protein